MVKRKDALDIDDYGARFYDPVIARWTSVDSNVEHGQESTSRYGYVFDDPMRFTDPDVEHRRVLMVVVA